MTGLRKRVTIGFLSIVCLLFFSGIISFVELSQISSETDDILKASKRNVELAKEMLDAAHEQNVALIHLAVFGDRSYDSLCRASMNRLDKIRQIAQDEALDKSFLDSLAFSIAGLRVLTDQFMNTEMNRGDSVNIYHPDSMGGRWYQEEYERLYGHLTASIKNYMTSTQSSLAPRTEQMKNNAYRAVTPVLISLAVMIVLVLMLYYFMTIYCVNPIVRLNKSLGDSISYHIPFTVKGDLKDEMLALREKIEFLYNLTKQNK